MLFSSDDAASVRVYVGTLSNFSSKEPANIKHHQNTTTDVGMDKLQEALSKLGDITLNDEQYGAVEAVFKSCAAGRGVFVTGQAGTGKSTLIQVIVPPSIRIDPIGS